MDLSSFKLDHKIALVTGGSSGIGKMMSMAFLKAGAIVYIASRNDCPEVLAQLTEYGKVVHYKIDVTQISALEKMVEYIDNDAGSIDILVNAAGVNFRTPATEMTLDIWQKTIDINLTIPYQLSQLVVAKMKRRNWGRIINIASLQSYRAFDHSIPYGASKGGIVQLTRALAQAYSLDGILVNAIAPGFFKTNLTRSLFDNSQIISELADKTMMGRNGESDDLFGISVFLASDANSYITGQTIALDGGFLAK